MEDERFYNLVIKNNKNIEGIFLIAVDNDYVNIIPEILEYLKDSIVMDLYQFYEGIIIPALSRCVLRNNNKIFDILVTYFVKLGIYPSKYIIDQVMKSRNVEMCISILKHIT
jgi:hypothetical protein